MVVVGVRVALPHNHAYPPTHPIGPNRPGNVKAKTRMEAAEAAMHRASGGTKAVDGAVDGPGFVSPSVHEFMDVGTDAGMPSAGDESNGYGGGGMYRDGAASDAATSATVAAAGVSSSSFSTASSPSHECPTDFGSWPHWPDYATTPTAAAELCKGSGGSGGSGSGNKRPHVAVCLVGAARTASQFDSWAGLRYRFLNGLGADTTIFTVLVEPDYPTERALVQAGVDFLAQTDEDSATFAAASFASVPHVARATKAAVELSPEASVAPPASASASAEEFTSASVRPSTSARGSTGNHSAGRQQRSEDVVKATVQALAELGQTADSPVRAAMYKAKSPGHTYTLKQALADLEGSNSKLSTSAATARQAALASGAQRVEVAFAAARASAKANEKMKNGVNVDASGNERRYVAAAPLTWYHQPSGARPRHTKTANDEHHCPLGESHVIAQIKQWKQCQVQVESYEKEHDMTFTGVLKSKLRKVELGVRTQK